MRRPVVLGRKELKEGSLNKDMSVFVALGIFDFDEESIEEVWCLQLTLEEGLMLCKKDDGTFQRIGVFQVCKMDWYDSVAESEVRLV